MINKHYNTMFINYHIIEMDYETFVNYADKFQTNHKILFALYLETGMTTNYPDGSYEYVKKLIGELDEDEQALCAIINLGKINPNIKIRLKASDEVVYNKLLTSMFESELKSENTIELIDLWLSTIHDLIYKPLFNGTNPKTYIVYNTDTSIAGKYSGHTPEEAITKAFDSVNKNVITKQLDLDIVPPGLTQQKYDFTITFKYDETKPIMFKYEIDNNNFEAFSKITTNFFNLRFNKEQINEVVRVYPMFDKIIDRSPNFNRLFKRKFIFQGVKKLGEDNYEILFQFGKLKL